MSSFAQKPKASVIYKGDMDWAQEKLKTLTLDEKIGQLFMVAAYSNQGKAEQDKILKLIKEDHIGGLIFMQGGPDRQAKLTNLYQQSSAIPLMIAMDAEWGLAMRLDSTFKFPWAMTVGATRDSTLAYQMGKEIAEHCKRLGVNINFGPVVDINTNPDNPIINARSFGEKPDVVTKLGEAYMKGMQDQHVLACAKHFPGHGDTEQDSHKTLPTVDYPMEHLKEVELSPYQDLINKGLGSIMVAHLNVPAMDNSGTPSSLSAKIIKNYLRDTLDFHGLVFTDALNMHGVADLYSPGEVDVKALLADNDILLFSQDVPTAIKKIKEALDNHQLTMEQLDYKVLKILMAKSWMNEEVKEYVEPKNIVKDLSPSSSSVIKRQIYEKAITVLLNKEQLIPVRELKDKKIACVTAGVEPGDEFYNTLRKYAPVDRYSFTGKSENELLNKLSNYDLVILGIYTSNANPWKSYVISNSIKAFTTRLCLQNKTIITDFANPYSLKDFAQARAADGLIVAYQNDPDAESVAAQVIFGGIGASGRLPVTAGPLFTAGFGFDTQSLNRLGYGLPGEVGLDPDELDKIDLLAKEAIREKAAPGCQIIVARHGKVVFDRTYGYHTYDKKVPVNQYDLYDLASVTKMAATLPMIMKLAEEGKIDIDKTLGDYLPELKGTNKADLVLRDVLTHQARLTPWIPFYMETLNHGYLKPEYYSHTRSFDFPLQVADSLYSMRNMRDTIIKRIAASDLLPVKEYKYSDLGFYLFMVIVERLEGETLDKITHDWLYSTLGAYTTTFKPLEKYPLSQIVPTENDQVFRKQQVHGYVHDQGAAMLGGVSGHAGLFSDANDLAKIMQMYLNGGNYGGIRYLDSVTLQEFTRCQFCDSGNRRGLGFDKPQLSGPGPTCGCVSPLSFGHTGFTGTIAWADPDEDIVYIFLSNRVYPDAANRKLLTLSTRTRIQKVIYNSIKDENNTGHKLISQLKP